MADISVPAAAQTVPFSFLSALAAPFVKLGAFLVRIAEANARVQQAQALMNLSDAELEKRGIKRNEIVHYVFGYTYFV